MTRRARGARAGFVGAAALALAACAHTPAPPEAPDCPLTDAVVRPVAATLVGRDFELAVLPEIDLPPDAAGEPPRLVEVMLAASEPLRVVEAPVPGGARRPGLRSRAGRALRVDLSGADVQSGLRFVRADPGAAPLRLTGHVRLIYAAPVAVCGGGPRVAVHDGYSSR